MQFAKACTKSAVSERSGIAIMGFNAPEWTMSYMGGIMSNLIATGIYITNEPEACLYQINHAEAEVVVVETQEHLNKILVNIDKMPQVKVIVMYGEEKLPKDVKDSRVVLWADFLKIGQKDVPDEIIYAKMRKQNAGNCTTLIYTSGTTGNPKGCMISHDNLTWTAKNMMLQLYLEKPELMGHDNRIVSYLPLSHIAGLEFDILLQLCMGH